MELFLLDLNERSREILDACDIWSKLIENTNLESLTAIKLRVR